MRNPDFIIVGAQKAGTTAAARNLDLHPSISMFRGVTCFGQKEIEFFNQHWNMGGDWYRSHFDGSNRLLGEKTAELLHRTICHHRMHLTCPDAKLVVILRSPVERAFSQWRMAVFHKGDEQRSFEEVIEHEMRQIDDPQYLDHFSECCEGETSTWRQGYVLKGMYARQLKSLLGFFPSSQVLVLIAEKILCNMDAEYAKLMEFLGVDVLRLAFDRHFVGKPYQEMPSTTRRLLQTFYRGHNERLFEMIGYEAPGW